MKQPPKHLSREAKGWWSRVTTDFSIEDEAGHLLLQTAMECFDEMRAAQALIAEDGYLIKHGTSKKLNPAAGVAKDSRAHMLQCFKQLNLDIEPKARSGRPAMGR